MAVTARPVPWQLVCSFRTGKGPTLNNGFLSTPSLSEPLLHLRGTASKHPHFFGFLLLPKSDLLGNGAGPGLVFRFFNAEKYTHVTEELGPRIRRLTGSEARLPPTASWEDTPLSPGQPGVQAATTGLKTPQLLETLHVFKPFGRITFIFTVALKQQHSREEIKAKREQRPWVIL